MFNGSKLFLFENFSHNNRDTCGEGSTQKKTLTSTFRYDILV